MSMNYPQGTLSAQQVRTTFFVVPELPGVLDFYTLVLGAEDYRQFQADRQRMHTVGGELLLIGWPDGTTVTYSRDDRTAPIDLDTLAATYGASATLYRIANSKASS